MDDHDTRRVLQTMERGQPAEMDEMGSVACSGRHDGDDDGGKDHSGFLDSKSSLAQSWCFELADDKADKNVLTGEMADKAQRCGSTASIALLHSLDEPAQPYWSSRKLNLIIGHCG